MGYYSEVTQDSFLDFVEPLTEEQLSIAADILDYTEAFFELNETGLEICTYERYKAYGLEEEIARLVSNFPANGVITVVGEEHPDIWRLVVEGSTVKKEFPEGVWPDGTKFKLSRR